MSSPPDLPEILAQAQKLQAKMGQLQRELAVRRFEGSAGGGMVTAVVSGELRVLEIRIEPSMIESGDGPKRISIVHWTKITSPL